MVMWNSFSDKIIVTNKMILSKTTLIQAICHKHEKRRADFLQVKLKEAMHIKWERPDLN